MEKQITVKSGHVEQNYHTAMDAGKVYSFLVSPNETTAHIVTSERTNAYMRDGYKHIITGTRGKVWQALDTYTMQKENVRELPVKGKSGRLVRSGRLFGAELELTRGGETIRKHYKRASGVELKRDASVNGESIEVTTPPLSGTTAEHVFNTVLRDAIADAKTDTSCGLHVHIDARDFKTLLSKQKTEAFKRLVMLYMSLQPFMFSVVPASRRRNSYCKSMANALHYENIKNMDTDARNYINTRVCQGDRYQWFNLVPFYAGGHYEIRLHGGTHDTRKVLEWANLHTLLADGAMHKWFTTEDMDTMLKSGSLRTLEILAERLRLSPQSVAYWRTRISRFNTN